MNTVLFSLFVLSSASSCSYINIIPDEFLIGAASAAYQIEGAWNEDGKGESIWDHFLHTHPEYFAGNVTGDTAADSYHKYKEDIQALKDIGAQHYRFSISWPRIMPTGDITNINQKGIDYYNDIINELLENDIIPLVTMYHFDLPQSLQDLGGWVNPVLIDYFEDYARVLFTEFGDRVEWWVTFNEPHILSWGYITPKFAPGINATGIGNYLAVHTILKAHARAYHLYDEQFRQEQKGRITMALDSIYAYPKTDSEQDKYAANYAMQDTLGWVAHPVYSKEGDYPAILKEFIGNQSEAEGRYRSRLPEFDDYWINYIKGTYDYFGLNHYSSFLISYSNSSTGYETSNDPSWILASANNFNFVPEGLRKLINWITSEYDRPDIFITENGWADTGGLNDTMRVDYINSCVAEILKAIHIDNSSVIGYTVWSLLDNLEWTSGDTVKMGLYEVDFNDPERKRTAKASAMAVSQMISSRQLPEEYFEDSL